jgi:hypothetical protein
MQIVQVDDTNVGYTVQLGSELVSQSAIGHIGPPFDWEYTLASTKQVASRPDYYIRLAKTDAGEYAGFVAGHVASFFFSPALMCFEDAWYVREGTVGRTLAAVKLMRGLVKWAIEEKGAMLVQSGDVAGINSLAVDTLYKHLGFKRFGSIYKYSKEDKEAA